MNRLTMTKITDENKYDTFLFKRNDNKEFIITFANNLDLYFCLYNFNDESYFRIDKDNYVIYELFDKLYNDIKNCNIFDNNETKERYLKYIDRYEYKKLFKDNIITWKCDDYPDELAPSFNIIKEEDAYIIKFNPCIIDKDIDYRYPHIFTNYISIRIRNSGSKYDPFNYIFMRLYNSLSNLDEHDLEQVHLEEYLFNEKKTIVKKITIVLLFCKKDYILFEKTYMAFQT